MPYTRSTLELNFSPVEVGSLDTRQVACDLTNYLSGGSINSIVVTVKGGFLDTQDLWTDVTSTVYQSNTLVGNIVTVTLKNFTAGYGYRVIVQWNSATSGNFQVFSRFFIVRCLY